MSKFRTSDNNAQVAVDFTVSELKRMLAPNEAFALMPENVQGKKIAVLELGTEESEVSANVAERLRKLGAKVAVYYSDNTPIRDATRGADAVTVHGIAPDKVVRTFDLVEVNRGAVIVFTSNLGKRGREELNAARSLGFVKESVVLGDATKRLAEERGKPELRSRL
jgi:hypothetical protein